MNPEKTASVYNTKFQKKWMVSCDEAKKIIIDFLKNRQEGKQW